MGPVYRHLSRGLFAHEKTRVRIFGQRVYVSPRHIVSPHAVLAQAASPFFIPSREIDAPFSTMRRAVFLHFCPGECKRRDAGTRFYRAFFVRAVSFLSLWFLVLYEARDFVPYTLAARFKAQPRDLGVGKKITRRMLSAQIAETSWRW